MQFPASFFTFFSLVFVSQRCQLTKTRKEGSLVTDEIGIFMKKELQSDRCTIKEFAWSDCEIPHQP